MTRLLRSTIRTVIDETAYRAAWARVFERVSALGARAWMFRSTVEAGPYIEFIEWKQAEDKPDLLADPELSAALAQLDDFGRGTVDTWIEP